jgi:hypothetical protein
VNALDWIPGVGLLRTVCAVAAITSLVSTGVGIERYYAGKRAGVAQDEKRSSAVLAELQLDAERRLSEMLAVYRSLEQGMNATLKEYQDAYRKAQAQNRIDVAAARSTHAADVGVLREWAARATACDRPAATDPAAPGSGDAAALGDVLADALRVQAQLAGAAEGHADAVRALFGAWPVMKAAGSP